MFDFLREDIMNLQNVWKKPIYLPGVQADLTDEILTEFEHKIGYRLPQNLIELFKIQNGGYVERDYFEYHIRQIWGIGDTYDCLLHLAELDPDELPELDFSLNGLIAFDGDGHFYHCLDYRQNPDNPQITFIDIECNDERIIAESFDEFLVGLSVDVKNIWVIQSDKTLDEVAAVLSKQLSVIFEKSDTFNYGYEYFSAKYLGEHLIFVRANQVPYAFARKGDRNFKDLKNYVGKTALQYPQIDKNAILLTIYDEKTALLVKEKLKGILQMDKLEDLLNE